jgi:hypothetical protein
MQVSINQAILHVYGKDAELPAGATRLTASGEPAAGELLSNKGDVIDGEYEENSSELTAGTFDSATVRDRGVPFPPTHPQGSTPSGPDSLAAEGDSNAASKQVTSELLAELDRVPIAQRTAVLELLQAHTTHTSKSNSLVSSQDKEEGRTEGERAKREKEKAANEQTKEREKAGAADEIKREGGK